MLSLLNGGRRYRDGEVVDAGGVSVRLRVNPRARRVSLRVGSAGAVATAPSAGKLREAVAFAETKAAWLRSRLARAVARTPLTAGETLMVRGRPVRLEQAAGAGAARLSADGASLSAGGDEAGFARRVLSWLKREARRDLEARTAVHAAALGVAMPAVTVRDTRSRWGSCNAATARLNYSWRLVMTPPEVLDYVAAHEVAHLREPNHGTGFWALVARLYGDCGAARAWLRAHGAGLHAVGR